MARGGASTALDQAPDSGLTHPLYEATDGFMGYPGVNGLTPAANDRHMYDSLPRHLAYCSVGYARGMTIWKPPPFADATSTSEEAQYQQLAGVGPWNAAVGGDRNLGRTGASPEATTMFSYRPRPYEVQLGPMGHQRGDQSPAAVAPPLRRQSREPTFRSVHKDVRERLRQGDSSIDGARPDGEASLHGGTDGTSGVGGVGGMGGMFGVGGMGGVGGGRADGNLLSSAHIWSFGETVTKEGVPPAGTFGLGYNPWSTRGWRTYTAAAGPTPPPPSGASPH
ncbi:hypothetical protein MMPV_000847 [Pyropia vietnamensis]